MKARLLNRNGDFDWSRDAPWNAGAMDTDLALTALFNAMAQNDPTFLEAARKVIFAATEGDCDAIVYRQDVLRECLHHENIVRELYAIATEAMDKEKRHYLGTLARYPHWVLRDAIEQMEMFVGLLKRLRRIADDNIRHFTSDGWSAFFDRAVAELDDKYFAQTAAYLHELKLYGPTLLSAGLSDTNRPDGYVLHRAKTEGRSFWRRLWIWFFPPKAPPTSFFIHPRDEAGTRALGEIHDKGIAFAAAALAQARDHIKDFFAALRLELAFYLGCTTLHKLLTEKGEPLCFPVPVSTNHTLLSFRDLYDVSLSLTVPQKIVGNAAHMEGRGLIVITGANQGGKSTFLRSIGLAQLMMQAGMMVGAESFNGSVCRGVFTHYKREESAGLESGKLDEELGRMSQIVDRLAPDSLVLSNESFAATNEREGSEIAHQIIGGLLDCGIRIVCVTHLHELARKLYEERQEGDLFVRPLRRDDGTRTFKLVTGEPLATSFGTDLYDAIFLQPSHKPPTVQI